MTGPANRGKVAEGLFKAECVKRANRADFAWHRFPDAHSGSKVVAPCDFMVYENTRLHLVEVKETDFENRLPHGNVDPLQISRIRLWKAAGAKGFGLIYFTPLKAWRLREVDYFLNPVKEDEKGKRIGSWFFDGTPTITLEEAFRCILSS